MISDALVATFDELMRLRPTTVADTEWFADKKHNNDLCPAFERQSNRVLDAFSRFRRVAYDVQGRRDRGIDVAIRWDDGAKYLIGMQVKGVWDLQQADYLAKLKMQAFEALTDNGPLLRAYYLVLCVPPTKMFRDRIRNIKSEFKSIDHTLVVDPTNALAFLRHGSVRMDVVAENILRTGDPIRDAARASIASLPPTQAAIVLWLASRLLQPQAPDATFDDIASAGFIRRVYAASPDIDRRIFLDREIEIDDEVLDKRDVAYDRERDIAEQLSEDIDALLAEFVETRPSERYRVIHDSVVGVIALQYDAYVRLAVGRRNAAEYVFHLLELPDRFELALEPSFDVAEA